MIQAALFFFPQFTFPLSNFTSRFGTFVQGGLQSPIDSHRRRLFGAFKRPPLAKDGETLATPNPWLHLAVMPEVRSSWVHTMVLRACNCVDSFHLKYWWGRRFRPTVRLAPVPHIVLCNDAPPWGAHGGPPTGGNSSSQTSCAGMSPSCGGRCRRTVNPTCSLRPDLVTLGAWKLRLVRLSHHGRMPESKTGLRIGESPVPASSARI